jgi:hypothetical protein
MTFEELWKKYVEAVEARDELCERQSPSLNDGLMTAKAKAELDEERQRRENRRKSTKEIVLGHPDSFDCVRCWMVDAKGSSSECCAISPQLIEEMTEDAMQGLGHQYTKQFGALTSEVRDVMAQWNLTDSGGGCNSWHLGCHCTEAEARELCEALYNKFSTAIKSGLLKIERKAWSLRLKD